MKIMLADTLGYCLGVRRAMDTAFHHLSRRGEVVYSHGQLIHNGPALEVLAAKGLRLWRGEKEGVVIIRAHGLPPAELAALRALEAGGLTISDATCPRVLRIQRLVAREAARGRMVIIWGKADHPEVTGLLGHAGALARVAAGPAEVAGLPPAAQVLLVSQTTQDMAGWPEMAAAVAARWPEALISNTICPATETRQREVRRLAGETEALVVIGGRTSGNTARLAQIGLKMGRPTWLVETADDLDPAVFKGLASVGLAAGASTSIWQIAQVLQALRALARSQADSGCFWPRLLRALVLSNIWAALGLATLAQSVRGLMFRPPLLIFFSFFFFLVAALHLFRDFFQGCGASQSQVLRVADPDHLAFLAKYGRPLAAFALLSAALAALAAALAGHPAPAIFGLIWLAALLHQFIPRPDGRASLGRALLGPALLAGGWGAAMVWAAGPAPANGPELVTAIFAGGAAFGQVLALAIIGDVLAVQGDRLFGRPTLPTAFGEKATRRLLTGFLLAWSLWLAVGLALHYLPAMAGLLIISGPVYNFLLLKHIFPSQEVNSENSGGGRGPAALHGFYFEALVWGQLLLAGLMPLILVWP